MDAIAVDKIRIGGAIEILQILKLSVHANVNQHAYMYLRGTIANDFQQSLPTQLHGKEIAMSCMEDGKETPYFSGFIQRVSITYENQLCYADIVCVSYSYLFDISPEKRSFQNERMTYKQLFAAVAEDRDIVVVSAKDECIGHPLIQYDETD